MQITTCKQIGQFLVLLILSVLTSCGGGSNQLIPVVNEPIENHTVSEFMAVGTGSTSLVSLGVNEIKQNGQILVQVTSQSEQSLSGLFFELEYNQQNFTPLAAQATNAIAPLSECLCLEILDVPGLVSYGQAPFTGDSKTVGAGEVLAEVLFKQQPFPRNTVSTETRVPQNNYALSPMVWDTDLGEFQWYMVNPGDYDQNGIVGISDLTPLVTNFGAAGPFSFFGAPSVVDGHSDGDINISDITPISLYWNNYIEGFNLYSSSDLADVPTAFNQVSGLTPIATYFVSDALGTQGEDRSWFRHTPEEGADDLYYWVRPFAGGMEGTRSNLMSPTMDTTPPLGNPGGGFNLAPTALLSLNYNGTSVPLNVTFDASESSDSDGEIALYEWDFEGDGLFDSFSTTPVVTHTFLTVGTYAPLVRVSDDGGLWDTFQSPEFVVEVDLINNIAPLADIFPTSSSGGLPFTVGFSATGSIDIDGYIAKYEWDFDGDGEWDLDSGFDPTVLFTYTEEGQYDATVQVTDNLGKTSTDFVQITAADNQGPVAYLLSDVESGSAPLKVSFNASGSFDYEGEIVEYAWDWDGDGVYDGTSGSSFISHTYKDEGEYTAIVRVEDDHGNWDFASLEISVGPPVNILPVADLIADIDEGFAPLTINFDASASYDPDGSIVEYAWDWDGNGVFEGFTYDPKVTYTFTSAGSPDVRVRVQDNEGGGTVAKVSIKINVFGNAPPVALLNASPQKGDYPLLVTFDASGSTDPDGVITTYEWDFDGDGVYDLLDTNTSEQFTYEDEGLFLPKVRVTDDVGAQHTSTITIQVHVEDWSLFGHDLQHTRQSWFLGPQIGARKWEFTTGGSIWSSPVIGSDSTVYIGCTDDKLYAINPDGTLKWTYNTGDTVVSPPAVGEDQTVYMGSWSDKLYAINPGGSLKWSFTTGGNISASPTIGNDGTIYIGSADANFYAVNPDGSEKWSYTTNGAARSTAAIAPGGTIYFGNDAGNFYALNPDGTEEWVYPTGGGVSSSPSIASDGTIYFGSNDANLYALNPDGTFYWTYPTSSSVISSPAIAFDGTIYVGSYDNNLHAVNPDGTGQWIYAAGGIVRSSPAIGLDGTIYVGSYDNKLHAVKSDGTVFWTYQTTGDILSSPALSLNGTLYFGCTNSKLYALQGN